jgi:hypothetical protein
MKRTDCPSEKELSSASWTPVHVVKSCPSLELCASGRAADAYTGRIDRIAAEKETKKMVEDLI